VTNAQTQSCIIGAPAVKDLSQSLSFDPFDYQRSPGHTVAKTRVTNITSVTVKGPVQVLLEGMPQGHRVVNPDGDYFGSPFITLVSGSLAPGQSEDVTVEFDGDLTDAMPSCGRGWDRSNSSSQQPVVDSRAREPRQTESSLPFAHPPASGQGS
jgi:hypothetical protein